jgi:hypothetical protein
MGHWSTYRKRGTCNASPTLIPAPPAPGASHEEFILEIHAEGANDVGGSIRIYGSDTDYANKALVVAQAWARDTSLDLGEHDPYTTYWVTEVGNGVVYLGESPPSEPVTP